MIQFATGRHEQQAKPDDRNGIILTDFLGKSNFGVFPLNISSRPRPREEALCSDRYICASARSLKTSTSFSGGIAFKI